MGSKLIRSSQMKGYPPQFSGFSSKNFFSDYSAVHHDWQYLTKAKKTKTSHCFNIKAEHSKFHQ